ncbi:hypothetical protein I6I07_23310 [Achromobacter deleyi]|uniref:Uncharacterized protein n=1 Tax=Achromobacter deleyi TaxID=1353891 RepID=A0A7T4B0T9_9BURK|nr:hypothetical protein [Achromobacter deleyi]QQB33536.1 hypothetical protein I6I07_23310 [Achromobacter deleyi]
MLNISQYLQVEASRLRQFGAIPGGKFRFFDVRRTRRGRLAPISAPAARVTVLQCLVRGTRTFQAVGQLDQQ